MNNYEDIQHVFTSPLRRAVATATIGLGKYPYKERNNLKFKAEPWLRETVKSQCDIPYFTDSLKELYPELDLSAIHEKFWFLEQYVSSETNEVDHREQLKTRIAQKDTDEEKLSAIIDYMQEISPKRIEDSQQTSKRVAHAKEVVGSHLRQIEAVSGQDIKHNSVLLVAHSNFLRHFSGSGLASKNGETSGEDLVPKDGHRF